MCIVEFTGLCKNFLVCKLNFYTVKFTVYSVNVFTVFVGLKNLNNLVKNISFL